MKALTHFSRFTLVTLGTLTALAGAAACGATRPPTELVDARAAYHASSTGPAATEAPAQLHGAKTALDDAERAFDKDGNTPETRDKAYIAIRRAQLANVTAQLQMDAKAKIMTEAQAQQLQAQKLQEAQQNLSTTKTQLETEKVAREEADRKARQAMVALQKIAKVTQETRGMVITLSGPVLFQTNKATLLPTAISKLNDIATTLKATNPTGITIEGHTDATGGHDHNVVLSQQRADAVKAHFVSRGLDPDKIKTVGMGPDHPAADDKSPEGRAINRRVEIIVEPNTGAVSAPGQGQ